MHKNGISHYGLIDLGMGFSDGEQYFNLGIGYQIGLKVKQVMEFQPFVRYVLDSDLDVANETIKENKQYYYAHYVDPGMRIVFNCGYPFQLFVQASYAIPVAVATNEYGQTGYSIKPGHGGDMLHADMSKQFNIGGGIKINF
jgi:hypothetical protein